MEWMLDIQLGRRNLSPIQRIAVAEKYRPIYEKQALINKQNAIQKANLENPKHDSKNWFVVNLPQTNNELGRTSEKLANIAGVSTDTYSKGKKILESNDENIKNQVLSGNEKNRKRMEKYIDLFENYADTEQKICSLLEEKVKTEVTDLRESI